jgi:beta-1,2-mannobiose phosphorylase / 1,2-beta-oligomannan phosphorylase
MESVRIMGSVPLRRSTRRLARAVVASAALLVLLLGASVAPPLELQASPGNVDSAAFPGWDSLKVIDPVVIQDGSLFKMWYTGVGLDQEARIGYATSPDGVNWTKYADNPVLNLGPSGSWDQSWVRANAVIKQGATYKLWFASGGQIGYATSPDGIVWTKHAGNPVLTAGPAGSWDEANIVHIYVMLEAGTYKMWYTGVNSSNFGRIGFATSPDGITWTRFAGNPVLDVGPGAWEAQWVFDPCVLFVAGSYRMWYSGVDTLPWANATLRVGLATGPNETTWTKSAGNPVLDVEPGGWDTRTVTAPWVLYDGATYHMWYHGGTAGSNTPEVIGYATSTDGVAWTRYAGNPVFRVTDPPARVFLPTIQRN